MLLEPATGTDPKSAKLPNGQEDPRPWQEAWFGDEVVIDKQNDKAPAVDHIYRECLAMHREAQEKSSRGFFGRLFH